MTDSYDNRTIAEIIYDYAIIRGDLSEPYARDQLAKIINDRIENHAAGLHGRCRNLVSDWEANGNSRELGDPTASTWHQAARQLLDVLG